MNFGDLEITAGDLQAQIDAGALLLDVREPWEFEICHIPGSLHIPMGVVPDKLEALPKDAAIITVCHHGIRSLDVALYLREQGFANVKSLRGGVDAYSWDVDPGMARY